MIKVSLYKDSIGLLIGYEISGHANYKPHGEDIICAAASILGHTALKALIEVVGISENNIKYSVNDDSGYLEVRLSTIMETEKLANTQIVLKTFEVGIKSMIESYPKYITIDYRGGGTRV